MRSDGYPRGPDPEPTPNGGGVEPVLAAPGRGASRRERSICCAAVTAPMDPQTNARPPGSPPGGDGTPWKGLARRFAEEWILPQARRWDVEDRMPSDVLEALARQRFLGLTVPPEYGGSGVDTRTLAQVLEQLAFGSLAVATLVAVHLSVAAAPIEAWGTPTQKERYLPALASGSMVGAFGLTEPEAGSDAQHLTTRYRRKDGGFVLDGSKMFITNGKSAGVVLTFATRDPSLGARGISAFLVPQGTPGFAPGQHLDKLGLRGSETMELVYRGCELPREALLGEEGQGFAIAMEALEGGRIGIAACSLGVAVAAFEELKNGLPADAEPWQRTLLARSFVEVEAARALVEKAARLKDSREEFSEAASVAKLYASQAAFKIASWGLDALGREVMDRSGQHRMERLFRDARVLSIVEGTTEIQEMILARRLRAHPPPGPA